MPPRLSVVVPAYNEERYLPRTLEALGAAVAALDLAADAVETIVADDSSTDRTAAIAEAAGARVVRCAHRQISRTRNAGADAATGAFLLFVDADTEVPPATLRAALEALEAGAAGGGCRIEFDAPAGLHGRAALLAWNALSRRMRWAAGGAFFARRDAFAATGGFPEDVYVAEEIYLSERLKAWGRTNDRPFVILREAVRTSPRKVRLYSFRELHAAAGDVLRRGEEAFRDRSLWSPWYDGRR